VSAQGGVLVYICRACGKEDRSHHVPDVGVALVTIQVTGTTPREWGIQCRLQGLHYCDKKRTGVADLVAGVRDE
jgi:hypothetical protein